MFRLRLPLAPPLRLALVLAVVWLAVAFGFATPVSADPIDDQARQIAKQLRCPICESVSVADSPAELAVQMRAVIRKKLEAGESEQQILDYFVAAYGDSVLLEPPRRGLGWLVWLGPGVALALGAVIVAALLRRWVASSRQPVVGRPGLPLTVPPPSTQPADSPSFMARQELEAIRRDLGR